MRSPALSAHRTGNAGRAGVASLAALSLLSLLWAASALRTDLLPNLFLVQLPRFEGEALKLLWVSLAAALIAVVRRADWPGWLTMRDALVVGIGLLAVPALLVSLASGWISGPARTALFTLVAVFAVVFEPYIGFRASAPSRGGLSAALLALAGSLLIFPLAMPDSLATGSAFAAIVLVTACIAAANCYAVNAAARTANSKGQPAAAAAIAAASAAMVLAAASFLFERPVLRLAGHAPELLWSAAVDAPALLLLFWLMPRLSASRMATRYLLAPLFAILLGAVLLQSLRQVQLQTWLGLALMAAGAVWLLLASPDERDAPASQLDLKGE
jgi:drug/metabolite transporter (DMT)-like permease